MGTEPLTPPADRVDPQTRAVAELLGREPMGEFTVVVRDPSGGPAVIRNEPYLPDGRPMPTLFWLVDRTLSRWVGRLEAAGGVDEAERKVGMTRIAHDHDAYSQARERRITATVAGGDTALVPLSGGVGGTRMGVKCLHAHLAAWMAGMDDAVGAWTAGQVRAAAGDIVEGYRSAAGDPLIWPQLASGE